MTCVTHFHTCDCREQKIAVLIKAAFDAAFVLFLQRNNPALSQEASDEFLSMTTRLYAAINELKGTA